MGRLVITANRLPVKGTRSLNDFQWEVSPGGLVSALIPIVREHRGAWVGWPGTSAATAKLKSFNFSGMKLRPVNLSGEEVDEFYNGFCNGTIWPLFHSSVRPPEFHRHWWWHYVEVNRRFANENLAILKEGDHIWIQDYHLMLVPRMIRSMRSKTRIGFFLHIPFPPEELFAHLPWRKQILEGLLASDLIGFQTEMSAENFRRAAVQFTQAKAGRGDSLTFQGRKCNVQTYPISVDYEGIERYARDPEIQERAYQVKKRMGNRRFILGVDRVDYTKGIDLRLQAFETLLQSKRLTIDDFVYVQIGVPSREKVPLYQELKTSVETIVGRVNGDFGEPGRFPLHYIHRSIPIEELIASYCAADVMLVTPLADGMNLVAKEYCASRVDDSGVLILSEFAGAARELDEAILVNPHDVDGLAIAIESALRLPAKDAERRMRKMRRVIKNHNVHDWANEFLKDLRK